MSKQRDILPEVVEYVSKANPGCGIILHGSVQHGYERSDSDVDLFAVINEGDHTWFDLDVQVGGVHVQVCYWPVVPLRKALEKEPYAFYSFAYGELLYDPAGVAKRYQHKARDYFSKYPDLIEVWKSQLEDVRKMRMSGRYENGHFRPGPDADPNHMWWDDFAEHLRQVVGSNRPSVEQIGGGAAEPPLLTSTFSNAQLNETLQLFLRIAKEILGGRLVSVILQGSVVFDDLAPGYGDLDFLAVVDGDLSEEVTSDLIAARRPLRTGRHGTLAQMLEGAFLPRKMLDPAVKGSALWWGTSGERVWKENRLGWMVLHVIRERGRVVWGEDVRLEIPAASRPDIIEELKEFPATARQHARGDNVHQVDWLLTSARLLLWLREGRLSSKSEAADWGYHNAHGRWRELLPRAKELRMNASAARAAEVKRWLAALSGPIQEAAGEVAGELSAC